MDDLIDSVTNLLGKNKKALFIFLVVYIIIMLVVLGVIWWPEKESRFKYEYVDISAKKEEIAQQYMNDIALLFKLEDTEVIKDKIDNTYVDFLGESKDKLIERLKAEGYFSLYANMKGMDVYTDGNTYVYSTTIYRNNNSRKLNIIETYPYEYTITFDDFYKYQKVNKTTKVENINFTINSIYNNLKYVEVDMKIQNLNDVYARFNFNNAVSVQAVLIDGKKYSAANLISTEDYTNIEKNTTINKKFVFEIPAQLQDGIEYIVFNNVKLEFSTINMKVNM